MSIYDPYGTFDSVDDNPRDSGDGRDCIGRVGAPPQKEATSTGFYWWVPRDQLVETSQIVTCESDIAGQRYTFHAIVTEVYRQSRKRNMSGEVDEADGDVNHQPPLPHECQWLSRSWY